ncbi:MAG: DUF1622 domain-containing protein [Bacteroidetes bacterium]|nr:DUF1622 domain-containing protein [Bacteroidota bacterium]
MQILNLIAIIIGIAGSVIIIWGVLVTSFLFLKREFKKLVNRIDVPTEAVIRYNFSSYLLLGLDFMLAADIIHTIHNPVLNELYILAMIVAIRSVISFFLHKEMSTSLADNNSNANK